MLVRIANGEDPDQTAKQSDLGLHCLCRPYWPATSVPNFRTLTLVSSLFVVCQSFCK